MPIKALVGLARTELAHITFTDKSLPVNLRITFLQLLKKIVGLKIKELLDSEELVVFLRNVLVDSADNTQMTALESLIGLDLLASAISYSADSQRMIEKICGQQSIEMQKLKKIFL